MFKAKLIENEEYYGLRSKQAWFAILPAMLIGMLVNFYSFPIWIVVVMVVLFVVIIVLSKRNVQRMASIVNRRQIEMDETEIRINSKKTNQLEIIKLEEIDRVEVMEYSIPQETMKEFHEEFVGKQKHNYLVLHNNNQKRKIDFEVDSHYMITQLNKVIESWKERGYKIEVMEKA